MEVHLIDDCNCSCGNHCSEPATAQPVPKLDTQPSGIETLDNYKTPGIRIVYIG